MSYGDTFTLERVLGTIAVHADGWAHTTLSALRSLFFVAPDRNGRSAKRMQSLLSAAPYPGTCAVLGNGTIGRSGGADGWNEHTSDII